MSKYTTTLNEILNSELQHKGFNEFINNGDLTYTDSHYQFIQKILYYDEDVQNIVTQKFFKGFRFNNERVDKYFKEAFVSRFLDREINRQTVEGFATQVLHTTITHEDYIYTVFNSEEMEKYIQNHIYSFNEENAKQTQLETQNQTSNETYNEKQNQNNSSETKNNGSSNTSNREANATLPQSDINLNVDDDVLNFADDNTITRNKNNSNDTSNVKGQQDANTDSERNGKQDQERNQNQDTNTVNNGLTKNYMIDNVDKLYDMRERIMNEFDKKCFLQIW